MTSEGLVLRSGQSFLARPFDGIDHLKDSLGGSELILDGKAHGPGTVELQASELPVGSAEMVVYFDVEGVSTTLVGMGIEPRMVRLACAAYGSVIAEMAVLWDEPLDEVSSPTRVPMGGAPLVLSSPNGFDARAFLYLAEDVQSDGFVPTRAGTWFSHVDFSVRAYSTLSHFSPTPLGAEERATFRLPKGSLTYVRVGDGLLDSESFEDEVEVFVDSSILSLLEEKPREPLSEYMQIELATVTMSAVISKAASLLELADGAPSLIELRSARHPVARLIDTVATASRVSAGEIVAWARTDPGRVRGCVEECVGTLRRASLALREVR